MKPAFMRVFLFIKEISWRFREAQRNPCLEQNEILVFCFAQSRILFNAAKNILKLRSTVVYRQVNRS